MKNLMKALSLALCLCLLLSLVACGGDKAQPQQTQGILETTQGTQPQNTEDQGPNENQCAGDPTTEPTDHPTEPSVPETTELEAIPEETATSAATEEETIPEAEEEPGDIQIPLDDVAN